MFCCYRNSLFLEIAQCLSRTYDVIQTKANLISCLSFEPQKMYNTEIFPHMHTLTYIHMYTVPIFAFKCISMYKYVCVCMCVKNISHRRWEENIKNNSQIKRKRMLSRRRMLSYTDMHTLFPFSQFQLNPFYKLADCLSVCPCVRPSICLVGKYKKLTATSSSPGTANVNWHCTPSVARSSFRIPVRILLPVLLNDLDDL